MADSVGHEPLRVEVQAAYLRRPNCASSFGGKVSSSTCHGLSVPPRTRCSPFNRLITFVHHRLSSCSRRQTGSRTGLDYAGSRGGQAAIWTSSVLARNHEWAY